MNMPLGLGAHRLTLSPEIVSRVFANPLAVLVVDDEPAVREELSIALGYRGMQVLSAASGEAALAVLAGRPDIGALVTDIRMPGMDGLELAQQALAGRDAVDAMEVVLVSGHVTPAQGMAAQRVGAFGTLPKPVRGTYFVQIVQQALGSAAARRAQALGFAPRPDPVAAPPRQTHPAAAAEALLHTLTQRAIDAETLATLGRQIRAPLQALLGQKGVQDAGEEKNTRRVLGLLDAVMQLAAIERGHQKQDLLPVSAQTLAAALADRLHAAGFRCARRIILQPEATPAFALHLGRMTQAMGLLAERALRGAGPSGSAALTRGGSAEVSVDAGAGHARIELTLRPDPMPDRAACQNAEPAQDTLLPLTIACRLMTQSGGRLDAWMLADGGLRARLLVGPQ